MSFKLIEKPKTFKVTQAIANQFANMETIPNDRPLSERRLIVYRKSLEEGSFRPVTWATCYCKETGTTYRVNGKHTSILLSSLPNIPEFYVTIEKYEADTLKETVELYNTFDSRTQSRTSLDINRSFAAVSPDLRQVQSNIINVVISSINYVELGDSMWGISATERAEKILDNVEFTLWVQRLYEDNPSNFKPLLKAGVIAAMFLTYNKSENNASEFWTLVRDETGASPETPDRKLAKFINKTKALTSTRGTSNINRASTHEFMVRSLHAWNAWRKKASTKLSYYPDAEVPKVM